MRWLSERSPCVVAINSSSHSPKYERARCAASACPLLLDFVCVLFEIEQAFLSRVFFHPLFVIYSIHQVSPDSPLEIEGDDPAQLFGIHGTQATQAVLGAKTTKSHSSLIPHAVGPSSPSGRAGPHVLDQSFIIYM